MHEPDYGQGPLDMLKNVFLDALCYVQDFSEYNKLIQNWNNAVEYCQKIFTYKK